MWSYEYSLDTDKTVREIWARYQNHETWAEWDQGLDHVQADGPLAVGTTGKLTPKGQRAIPFTITDVEELIGFTDECAVGDLVIRFRHELTRVEGVTRVTHGVVISGPGSEQAGPQVGPVVTAAIPASVAELVRLA